MINMNKEQIYIIFSKRYISDINENIYLKDIADIFCEDKNIKNNIESIRVYKSDSRENWDYLKVNEIIEKLIEKNQSIDIIPLGATEIIIEIKSKERENKIFEFIKATLIATVLFFGAGMGIMYFHEDVNMGATLDKLYYTFTGVKKENPLIMTISYSIGLGIGMITFFKRVISKSIRRRKEPGPLDIETYLYEKDMDEYILNEMIKGKKEK